MLRPIFLLMTVLFTSMGAYAIDRGALGQTLQINTHLNTLYGKPTWLLIIRNVNTGKVIPYMYDIKNEDNYWIALTEGPVYRVTTSTLTWGPFAKIHNFCHLENGILDKKSMWITLTGNLGPDKKGFKCHVTRYAD